MDNQTSGETVENNEADTANSEKQTQGKSSEQNLFSILGYLVPFFFFIPLLNDKLKNVQFVRFHANQQAILLLMLFASMFLHNIIYMAMQSLGMYIIQAVNIGLIILSVYGAWYAYEGKMKELPFVGHFRILK